MKVYIGKYLNYFGPYQLAKCLKIFGCSEETIDKIGDYLSETWVYTFLDWIESKRKRTEFVKIDNYDVWNLDHTLALIILPALRLLKENKHGYPWVDNEYVPEHLHTDGDTHSQEKWEWVLDEMIFAFESKVDDSWEDQFFSETGDYDINGMIEYETRIREGFKLFGIFYQAMWD